MLMPPAQGPDEALDRTARLERLRSILPVLEGTPSAGALAFAIPEVDRHLPQEGLALGALHEIAPASATDTAAAFGFAVACLAGGRFEHPSLLVVPSRFLREFGVPYGHGLHGLGLDPSRLVVFEAKDHDAALWAIEEALRSRGLSAVLAVVTGRLDLKASRRLHLAAASSSTFLLVLRPPEAEPAAAAVSRWRIAAAPARRDRFDTFENERWRVTLERSRNGRTGSWLMEWDHDEHRFQLATTSDPRLVLPLEREWDHDAHRFQAAGRSASRLAQSVEREGDQDAHRFQLTGTNDPRLRQAG